MGFEIWIGGAFQTLMADIMRVGFERMAQYIDMPLKLAFTLYFAIGGIDALKGGQQNDFMSELPYKVARVGLIYLMIHNWGSFSTYVFDGLMQTYNRLGGFVGCGLWGGSCASGIEKAPDIAGALNASFSQAMLTGFKYIARGFVALVTFIMGALAVVNSTTGLTDTTLGTGASLPAWAAPAAVTAGLLALESAFGIGEISDVMTGLIYIVATLIYHCIAFYTLVMTQITLVLVIIFAPLFISMYLFNATRPIAESWVRTVVAIVLTPAAIFITLGITQMFTNNGLDPIGLTLQAPFVGGFSEHLFRCLVWLGMGFFLLEVPGFISGMVGSLAGAAQGARVVSEISNRVVGAVTSGSPASGAVGQKMAPPQLLSQPPAK